MEEDNNQFDRDFMYYVIDRKIPFPLILEKAGYEDYDYYGNVYCPFHDNTDTPAGKLFNDEKGDKLFCFSERRMYRPSDVLKEGLLKMRVEKIFFRLWNNKLSEEEKSVFREQFGEEEDFLTEEFKNIVKKLEEFKRDNIDYQDYQKLVIEAVNSLE